MDPESNDFSAGDDDVLIFSDLCRLHYGNVSADWVTADDALSTWVTQHRLRVQESRVHLHATDDVNSPITDILEAIANVQSFVCNLRVSVLIEFDVSI